MPNDRSDPIRVESLGERGWLLRLVGGADARTARALAALIREHRAAELDDVIPSWDTVAVWSHRTDPQALAELEHWLADLTPPASIASLPARVIELPTCYGGEFGPDLSSVAAHLGLDDDEVVRRHASTTYEVAFLGFLPGFPYLEGLDPGLVVPRRTTPRLRVPAGSVGLAATATGVYPLESPGGWQLIGRIHPTLFDPRRAEPALLAAGDRVRFVPTAELPPQPTPLEARPAPRHPVFEVLAGGLSTSLQDLGRIGFGSLGLAPGGALDRDAHRLANRLVGNPANAATLEIDTVGPTLRALEAAEIALVGGMFEARLDGRPLEPNRPCLVPAGSVLEIGRARTGRRAWLAIGGGFDGPVELGSRAWHALAGLGSRVQRGQLLGRAADHPSIPTHHSWSIRRPPIAEGALRLLVAHRAHAETLLGQRWRVTVRADRMALVLEPCDHPAPPNGATTRLTEPVAFGTIQRLPDGNLAILLADRQTTGGYPRLGEIAAVDHPRLAQLRPGDELSFDPVPIDAARTALAAAAADAAAQAAIIAAGRRSGA